MAKLTLADVEDLAAYERVRGESRRRVIAIKEDRRVAVGERVSLLFENRDTVLSQVQEMVRAERIVEPDKIQFELDTYNALLPGDGELSATLFIEITGAADVRREMDRFIGLDRPGAVFLDLGGAGRAVGRFEAGHSTATRISAVHYVKFPVSRDQAGALAEGTEPIALVVDHPGYRARAELGPRVRRALAADLAR